MKPVGDVVYRDAVAPLMAEKIGPAHEPGNWPARPIKRFMVDQIVRTRHEHYLTERRLDYATLPSPDRVEPTYGDDYPFHVIAPAFLLSELTTALTIGFIIYLPFLVIDLVVSAVLAAMGLFMLPPSLVALPLKLILFVLADGWLLVASRLMQTFTISSEGAGHARMSNVVDWSCASSLRLRVLLLGGPPLAAALLVGLVIGMIQTMTQMHEVPTGSPRCRAWRPC